MEATHPLWARWNDDLGQRYTLGVEDELMLVGPDQRSLAHSSDEVLAGALALGCVDALDRVPWLAAATGADRQRAFLARRGSLEPLIATLARQFIAPVRAATTAGQTT